MNDHVITLTILDEDEGAEVDVAGAGAAASEIGVRCALSGVNFDFSVIGNLIN